MFSAEEKHRYNGILNTSISSTPTYYDLVVAPGQGEARESDAGVAYATRDGFKVQPISVSVTGIIVLADSYNMMRIIVTEYNNEPAGGTPSGLDFLYRSPSSSYSYVWATYNRDNVPSHVKILYDKRFIVHTYRPIARFSMRFKRLKPIKYNTDTATSWTQNYYYIWFVSDSDAASHPSILGKWSATFVNL